MNGLANFFTRLLETFDKRPKLTIALVILVIVGAVLMSGYYRNKSDGNQTIHSTGDGNTNINSK